MAPLPLASGSTVRAQQWTGAVRHTPPRFSTLTAATAPNSSSTPSVTQATVGATTNTVPFGHLPGSQTIRLVPSVNTVGATRRDTSAPKPTQPCGALWADPLERQQSRNSLKGGITPQGGTTPNGGSTPHGGTPRCRSRPHAQEPLSPGRPVGVHVMTSAAWRVASPRQVAEGTTSITPLSTVGTVAPNTGGPMVPPRPRSVGERGDGLLPLTSSRRLESPQLSMARFDSPQASPAVSARAFSRPGPPPNGIRISGDPEVAESLRMLQRAPAVSSTGQHPMSYQQGGRHSSGSHSHPVVPIHERVCRSPQTPPPHVGIEVGGTMGYRDSVGVASSPAVSSTADPCSFDSCSRSSGALLVGNGTSRSSQLEAWRHSVQPSALAPGPCDLPNSSSCNTPFGTSNLGSCPVLPLEESTHSTSEPLPSVSSTGAPPTPSPEDVPPWRLDSRSAKQESGYQSPGATQAENEEVEEEREEEEEYEREEEAEDHVDCNAGLLNDIGWTPSFHSLAVASPGVASNSSPTSVSVEPPQSQRQQLSTGPSTQEETARAMVMDIEAEAARAINEKWAVAETAPKSFVMKWDGSNWVPITQQSPEKASATFGGISDTEADRVFEELRSSVNFEAAERRRLEVLHSRATEHIADCERRIASLQGKVVEANSQRDDAQRQLKDKSDKHSELVKRFRRHQEANKRLEEDLSRAAELRKRLEIQAKQERLGKVAAEQMAKQLQLKVQDFEKEVTAVAQAQAQADTTDKVPADLEEQLEKLRQQLEETVRTVQLRCGPGSTSGDLSKAAAVAADATRGLTGSQHLSPSTLMLLEVDDGDTKPSSGLLGVGSWAGAEESTALSTEEELPTTEEQLLGEWSSTSLQFGDSQHDRGSGEVARLDDVDEELDLPRSAVRLMGCSSAGSLGGASIGSVPPSEIDEGDCTVVLPLREPCEEYSSTPLTASELSRLPDRVGSPSYQSDDGIPMFETTRQASRGSQNPIALSLRDLSEIKALKKPPPPIRMLMEVCCLLFHIQPVKQADERNAKKHKLDYWEPARRYLLSDPFFLSKLRMYEADEISSTQRAKIRKYFQDPEFTAERVKNCSKAAHELYEWVSQLVQSESECHASETRRGPPSVASARRRESPPCARTPPSTSATR